MNKLVVSKEIKELNKIIQPITLKLGRYYDDIFLADDKGNILIRKINMADYLYLKQHFKKAETQTEQSSKSNTH